MWSSDRKNIETIPRAYYHGSCEEFLLASEAEIYHELVHNSLQFDLTGTAANSPRWRVVFGCRCFGEGRHPYYLSRSAKRWRNSSMVLHSLASIKSRSRSAVRVSCTSSSLALGVFIFTSSFPDALRRFAVAAGCSRLLWSYYSIFTQIYQYAECTTICANICALLYLRKYAIGSIIFMR